MRVGLGVILLAVAVQGTFAAKTPETFRERYGKPVSETFLVRPGIVVSAVNGASGDTCELVIIPKEPENVFTDPSDRTIDFKRLKEIEEELVPRAVRRKYIIGSFIDVDCLPNHDCAGTQEDWEKLVIYANSGEGGARYELIKWNRHECGEKLGFH